MNVPVYLSYVRRKFATSTVEVFKNICEIKFSCNNLERRLIRRYFKKGKSACSFNCAKQEISFDSQLKTHCKNNVGSGTWTDKIKKVFTLKS